VSARPIISLLHPTARVKPSEQFPRGWRDAHDAWLERADHPEQIEYVLAVHESRHSEFWDSELFHSLRHRWGRLEIVGNENRDCCVDQLNAAAAASCGQLLVGIQDDLYPPEHWDTLILEALGKGGPEMFSLFSKIRESSALQDEMILVCSSGATPERDRELMMVGAITRPRYERYGFVLDPDFESMFADNWYAHVARRDEAAGLVKILERLDIQFEHRHPVNGYTGPQSANPWEAVKADEVYQLQNSPQAYQDGEITFKRKLGAKVIAIALPGQEFSSQWLHSWTVLYGHLMAARGFLTMPIFAYTSNVHCTRMEITKTVLEARHKPDYILWVDDDNTLAPELFDMLQKDLDDNPDLAGVVGWCWCDPADPLGDANKPYVASCGRQSGWNPDRTENGKGLGCYMFTLEDFEHWFRLSDQLSAKGAAAPHLVSSADIFPDAFWSGFPVVLMRYSTLEQLGPEAFAPMVRPDVKFGFTSEDTSFFYKAHVAGLKFAVDMRVKVPHLKLRAIEAQYLPGVTREEVLKAQGKRAGIPVREPAPV
jgi:hypothetical protein